MLSLLGFLPWTVAAIFAASGALHLAGPLPLRQAYRRWGYSPGFSLAVGLLNVVAAALLIEPEMRAWGIVLAAAIVFFAVVALLDHEKYLYAAPLVIVMLALVPTSLSIPARSHSAQYTIEKPARLSQN